MPLVSAELAPKFCSRDLSPKAGQPSVANTVVPERKVVHDPHILLATTGQLPSTARLAMELHEAGARISLIAPSSHPARALDFISDRRIYRALAPRACL